MGEEGLWGKSEGEVSLLSGEPWLSLLVRSPPLSLENGVWAAVPISLHCPVSRGWFSGASCPRLPQVPGTDARQWGRAARWEPGPRVLNGD